MGFDVLERMKELKDSAIQRHADLQRRLWVASQSQTPAQERSETARELWREIRSYLIKAANARLLDGGEAGVNKMLKRAEPRIGIFEIAVGNRRNFHRDETLPHFRRTRDHAWFDFQLLIADRDGGIDILAYDFELRLTNGSFVRFDLNPEGHGNEDIGLRSHVHINSDDDGMSLPAPVMSPIELLDVMVHGLVKTGRTRRID